MGGSVPRCVSLSIREKVKADGHVFLTAEPRRSEVRRDEPHIFHHVSLSSFTPHHGSPPVLGHTQSHYTDGIPTSTPSSKSPTEVGDGEAQVTDAAAIDDDNAEPTYYTLPCRCSCRFIITLDELEAGVDVIGCEGCGEWVRVGYEVIEDDGDSKVDEAQEE
jgi:hypothetical protein